MRGSFGRNVVSLAVVVGGLAMLASPAPVLGFDSTCTAGNGASCSGEICCADADSCSTGSGCTEIYCTSHPNSPLCNGTQ